MSEDDRPQPRRVQPLRVLFVCTANISRSPYAERRARQVLGDAPVAVASAGVPGYPGRGMDPAMLAQLRARGGDGEGHVSRSVSADMLRHTDLVLTFEFAQRMRLFDSFPAHAHKVFGLRQFVSTLDALEDRDVGPGLVRQVRRAQVPDSMSLDVTDPYERGRQVSLAIADEIDVLLNRVLPALAGRKVPELVAPASLHGQSVKGGARWVVSEPRRSVPREGVLSAWRQWWVRTPE